MKSGKNRTILVTALLFAVLSPDLISVARTKPKAGDQLVDSLRNLYCSILYGYRRFYSYHLQCHRDA